MLAGLILLQTSHILELQCCRYRHVVCRAVAGDVVAFVFVAELMTEHTQNSHTLKSYRHLCRDVLAHGRNIPVFRHVTIFPFSRWRVDKQRCNGVSLRVLAACEGASRRMLHTLHSALNTSHFSLYTLHCTLHTLHSPRHTLHPTLYTPHFTPYTSHPYTPHFTLYTPHSTLHTLYFTLLT